MSGARAAARCLGATLLLLAAGACGGVQPPMPTDEASPPAMMGTPLPVAAPAPIVAERIALAAPALARPMPPTMTAAVLPVLLEDHCVDRDLAAPATGDPAYTVLDRTYALPAAYVPPDLVPASAAGITGEPGTRLVSSQIVEDLATLRVAWEAAGQQLIVESGYRSYADQAVTFNAWAAQLGYAGALLRAARPGHSEHQLGTALDFTSPGWAGRVGDWAVESAEGAWLAEHGSEHGFVMSYPAGSQGETCFGYEPWHYRWIGREAAAEHRASGLGLREFLARRDTR